MIIKPLKPTHELLQIEALDRRLTLHHFHKEKISTQAKNIRAGYNGERALEFPLSFLPHDKCLILHQLTIIDQQGKFQIDALLLSKNFILIIEAKNIRNNVIFDDMGQTYRKEADGEQGFSNPVNQVNLQQFRLSRWLNKFNFPAIPIEKIVTYTNPSTILKNLTKENDLPKVVMQKEKLLDKVNEFSEAHSNEFLSEEQLIELAFELSNAHKDIKINVLTKYDIKKSELIKGVICSNCAAAPMSRKAGKWHCLHCKNTSFTAHRDALVDYALLIGSYINNGEARGFLQLNSSNVAKQLLQKEGLTPFGVTSGRRYRIELDDLIGN